MQCGAPSSGSLLAATPGWRPGAALIAATAILLLGAVAAAYAAWGKSSKSSSGPTVVTVAQVPAATTPAAPVTPTPAPLPTTTGAAKAPGSSAQRLKALLSHGTVKPPKIPLTAITPKTTAKTTTPVKSLTTPTTTTPATTTTPGAAGEGATGTSTAGEAPSALTLDTNAAATYNPYNDPASYFGDPSLAIDGEPSTGWTAQVNPAVAPKMAEGLVIDLKSAQKLSKVVLLTSTPGMTVQVYGANGAKLPSSITSKAWVPLSRSMEVTKKPQTLKLKDSTSAFRYITLWISEAPASSIGTALAPGHVTVNELELFPAS